MKILKTLIFLSAAGILLFFANCGDNGDGPSEEEKKTDLLTSQEWTIAEASDIVVPSNSATTSDQWVGFTVNATETNMSTAGHPDGATAVWPTGSWSFNDDLNKIIRDDGEEMTINTLNETDFSVTFTVPDGTELNARVAALGGEYTFNLTPAQ